MHILMADDDSDDCCLTHKALCQVSALTPTFVAVSDGEQLLEYLNGCSAAGELPLAPMPDVLLLDLNLPRLDGREIISRLRAQTRYSALPIVVLTTSTAQEDIACAYRRGANAYMSKALTYAEMLQSMAKFVNYWFDVVKLPNRLRDQV